MLKPLYVIWVLLALLSVVNTGCGKKFIPNTEIADNADNRDIVEFCERYRHAVEDMNIGLLLSMASPRYFDKAGTATGDDDLDYAGLEEALKLRFDELSSIRFEIKYRDLYEVDGVVHVEFVYNTNFQYEVEGKKKWSNKTADNRLSIERVEDGFLILTGM